MPTLPPPSHLKADAAFAAFHRLVVADAELFGQLQNFASTDEFAARAVELGAARGLTFRADDVVAALRDVRRARTERNPA